MNRNKYVKWIPLVILVIFASSCSQTRYSSRNYVKGHTISKEKKVAKESDLPEKIETTAIPDESETVEVPMLNPKEEISSPLFLPKSDPIAKAQKEVVRKGKLKESVKSRSQATVNPDQKSDGGGLRIVGWLLIIVGLFILLFASIVVGILLMLLGLLFVVVGKK